MMVWAPAVRKDRAFPSASASRHFASMVLQWAERAERAHFHVNARLGALVSEFGRMPATNALSSLLRCWCSLTRAVGAGVPLAQGCADRAPDRARATRKSARPVCNACSSSASAFADLRHVAELRDADIIASA